MYRRKNVKRERLASRKALVVVFNFLDPDGDGQIELDQFVKLMRHLRPDLASDKCQYIFDQLDGQNSYAFSSPGYCASGIDGSERNTDNNFASMACASLVIFQVMTATNWQLLTDGFFVRIVC